MSELRFRRPYAGGNSEDRTVSRWHIADGYYSPTEARAMGYHRVRALCGYTVGQIPDTKNALRSGMRAVSALQWTKAAKPPGRKGDLCTKCETKREERDA